MAPKRPHSLRIRPAYPLTIIQAVTGVLAYGRVSTDLQREADTIQTQVTKLEGTIRVRENPELPLKDQLHMLGAFWDDGVSGTVPLEEREEGRKIVAKICSRVSLDCDGFCGHDGGVQQLWITKLDRLARRLQILVDIEAFLTRHNVTLISVDDGINTSTHTGKLIFQILGAIAEWERERILERTTDGKHTKAKEGKWVGGRKMLGLKTDEHGYLAVDDTLIEKTGEMAYRMVQSIFDNIALHGSTPGRESRRTGLSERRIGLILHNKRYKGEGGIYDADGNWTAAEKNPPPQIVSPEKWQMAQDALIANRAKSGGRPHRNYLLSGLLTCCEPYEYVPTVEASGSPRNRPSNMPEGLCGRTFAGRHHTDKRMVDKEYTYYYCTRTLKNHTAADTFGCTSKFLPMQSADGCVWDLVKRFVSNPGEVIAQADSGRSDMLAELNRALGETVEQLSHYETERENVLLNIERSLRPRAAGEQRIHEIDAQVRLLEQQRDATEVQIRSLNYDRLDDERCATTVRDIVSELEKIERDNDIDMKKALIQAVVKRIEVRTVDDKPRLRVHLRFGGDAQILLTDVRTELAGPSDQTRMELRSLAVASSHPQELVLDVNPELWKESAA
jgi:site-specific DNA recombinase